jgi:hypothetical protein
VDYGGILKQALTISWRHRWLWLLGLLAGETSAGWSYYNYQGPSGTGRPIGSQGTPPDFSPVGTWIGEHVGLLVAGLVLLLLLFVVLLILSVIAEGAAVRGAAALDEGRSAGLGWSWRQGLEVFWPMLGLRLLVFVIVFLLVLFATAVVGLFIFAVASAHAAGLAVLLGWQGLGLLVLLFLPLALAGPTVIKLASRSVALAQAGPWSSLREVVSLVGRRIGPVAVLWVIEFGLLIGVGLAFAVAGGALFVPVLLGIIGAVSGGFPAGVAIAAIYGLIALAVLVVAGAAVAAFFSAYWTLSYRRLLELG